MTERRNRTDRRVESRYPLAGKIFWRQAARNVRFLGWLSDTSVSSLSFITRTNIRPAVDDEVEITDLDHKPQRCCVRRTASYDDRSSVVACTNVVNDAGR